MLFRQGIFPVLGVRLLGYTPGISNTGALPWRGAVWLRIVEWPLSSRQVQGTSTGPAAGTRLTIRMLHFGIALEKAGMEPAGLRVETDERTLIETTYTCQEEKWRSATVF